MGFKTGQKRPEKAGRKAGTPNKRSIEAAELAEALDCNPLEILLYFAKGDAKSLGYVTRNEETGEEVVGVIDPEMRLSAAKEACSYIYPKRKAIEMGLDQETKETYEEYLKSIK